jgi:hypothetical protein
MSVEGWEQVRAGLALIQSSRLAQWDPARCALVAAEPQDFEAAASKVHPEFGRVIMWIAFSVGAEYLIKGTCLVRDLLHGKAVRALRPPLQSQDVKAWAEMVRVNNPAVFENVVRFGTLKSVPFAKLLKGLPDREVASAGLKLLRDSIRNRDAHQYVRNVRSAHFRAVPDLFVPALNALLLSLGPDELRERLADGIAHENR